MLADLAATSATELSDRKRHRPGQSNSVLQGLWNINVSVAMRVPLLSRRSRNPKNSLWGLLELSGLDSTSNEAKMNHFMTIPCNNENSQCNFKLYAQPSTKRSLAFSTCSSDPSSNASNLSNLTSSAACLQTSSAVSPS